ncbi:MAG TPA: SDR family oxidoreductase [Chloroflexia bacterium]|nr:SDR family oxidoreductase [Chloroflexia bacterium]
MILVAGATGLLGSEICRKLLEKGLQVRAMVRPTSDATTTGNLQKWGATLLEADLKDPASLKSACQAVDTVISTVTTTVRRQEGDTIERVDLQGQLDLLNAAVSSGVKHFIYLSYSGNMSKDSPLTTAKRTMEQRLKESGMTYTILRPSYFMEVWLGPALGFDYASGKVQIFGNGQNKISFVSLMDVALYAVEAAGNPAARNTTINIGGPEEISPNKVVGTFEELSGRKFDITYVPEEALEAQYAAASDSLQKSFTGLMLNYCQGDQLDIEKTLKDFPVRLTGIRDYAARALAVSSSIR